jgi:hypothetical protein
LGRTRIDWEEVVNPDLPPPYLVAVISIPPVRQSIREAGRALALLHNILRSEPKTPLSFSQMTHVGPDNQNYVFSLCIIKVILH